MFKEIDALLTPVEVAELRGIAAAAQFVDGRISNPASAVKNNLQINDAEAYQRSSAILFRAMMRSEGFVDFAFPARIAPPMMTRYTAGMGYGEHPDAALIPLADGKLRSDLSCTIFLSEPDSYAGGALRVVLGTRELRFRGAAGAAIVYPSDMLHEVEPVTEGERLVAITFIQSRIADKTRRELLYDLNEVAALEGLNMSPRNYTRLQLVQINLMRRWTDKP